MVLQTSGEISLTNIQTEFGGSNPISINEYYAGGAYVPSGASGTNGSIPTSGAISISQFYGTYSAVLNFTNRSVSEDVVFPDPAMAEYEISNDGFVYTNTYGGGRVQREKWLTPNLTMSQYEVSASLTSGSLTSGTIDTWLSLGTGRFWQVTDTVTTQSAGLSFSARKIGDTTILDTWTVNLFASSGA